MMHGHACKQSIFLSVFNAMPFDGDPVTRQCEKEDKKTQRFQISHFHGSFSNDIMAGKGLTLAVASVFI